MSACPNPPTSYVPLSNVLVRATTSGGGPVYETRTSASGDYSLPVPDDTEVELSAFLSGPYWWIFDAQSCSGNFLAVCSLAAPETSDPLTAPAVWDRDFNSSSGGQFRTAHVNAAYHIEGTWRYFFSRLDADDEVYYPGLHDFCKVIVNIPDCGFGGCHGLAHGFASNSVCSELPTFAGFAAFTSEGANGGACGANGAYTTVLSHEYGHFVS